MVGATKTYGGLYEYSRMMEIRKLRHRFSDQHMSALLDEDLVDIPTYWLT